MLIIKRSIVFALFIFLFFLSSTIVINKISNTTYTQLTNYDKKMIKEYDSYLKYDSENEVWPQFDLKDKTIFALNKEIGSYSYVINPRKKIKSIFAKKILLPKKFNVKVYRVPYLYPLKLKFLIGNFNGKRENNEVLGNNVFYLKYSNKKSLKKLRSSEHFITYLTHEAFHYFKQDHWKDSNFRGKEYTNKELDLVTKQYKVLELIRQELLKPSPRKIVLEKYLGEYIDVMEQRKWKTSKDKLEDEMILETIEGTAEYVGIEASKGIKYDYNVMYFDNKTVSFTEVVPAILTKQVFPSVISTKIVYSSGALLCQLLNELEVSNWQETLNEQNDNSPVTLYSLLKEYYLKGCLA